MNETVKMIYVKRTQKGWRVFHALQDKRGEGHLIRDIYVEEDGQLPPWAETIQATISTDEEKTGIAVYLTAGTNKSAQYKPMVDPMDPTTKHEILVIYVNRRPDLPPKLFLTIEPAGVR